MVRRSPRRCSWPWSTTCKPLDDAGSPAKAPAEIGELMSSFYTKVQPMSPTQNLHRDTTTRRSSVAATIAAIALLVGLPSLCAGRRPGRRALEGSLADRVRDPRRPRDVQRPGRCGRPGPRRRHHLVTRVRERRHDHRGPGYPGHRLPGWVHLQVRRGLGCDAAGRDRADGPGRARGVVPDPMAPAALGVRPQPA